MVICGGTIIGKNNIAVEGISQQSRKSRNVRSKSTKGDDLHCRGCDNPVVQIRFDEMLDRMSDENSNK